MSDEEDLFTTHSISMLRKIIVCLLCRLCTYTFAVRRYDHKKYVYFSLSLCSVIRWNEKKIDKYEKLTISNQRYVNENFPWNFVFVIY